MSKENADRPPVETTPKPRRHAPRGPIIKRDLKERADLMDRLRCSAKSKGSQQQCKRPPIVGGTVCYIHGGAAPQVKFAAMERLMALQPKAVGRMENLIDQTEFPTVAYAASRDVLDRTMGRATEVQEVKISGSLDIVSLIRARHARHQKDE